MNALNFSGSVPIASNSATSAVDYAKFYSRSHDAVIRVYDGAGNVIETHENVGDRKWSALSPTDSARARCQLDPRGLSAPRS